jgi:tetratricopeptide (TPR) repeat protein
MNRIHAETPPWPGRCAAVLVLAVSLLAASPPASAQAPSPQSCGDLSNGDYGPFDYRKPHHMLAGAERNHFTPKVERLISGESRYDVGGDLSFLLVMYPNHARALMAMMRLGEKEKTEKPVGARYEVECYFERALRFRPDDNVVRMMYALYLSKRSRQAEAVQHLKQVVATAGDNPFTHYNAGLLYFELKEYELAAAQARAAEAGGFLRKDLIDKLKAVGKWTESEAEAPAPAAAASAASAPAPS